MRKLVRHTDAAVMWYLLTNNFLNTLYPFLRDGPLCSARAVFQDKWSFIAGQLIPYWQISVIPLVLVLDTCTKTKVATNINQNRQQIWYWPETINGSLKVNPKAFWGPVDIRVLKN